MVYCTLFQLSLPQRMLAHTTKHGSRILQRMLLLLSAAPVPFAKAQYLYCIYKKRYTCAQSGIAFKRRSEKQAPLPIQQASQTVVRE
jgi:hypothetical protein